MSLLLCFSGQIGSGKTSVSAAVASELNWPSTGFGDYLRSEIGRLGGNPDDRQQLQDLGQKLVEEDPIAFCQDTLAFGRFQPGVDFVIDGVRHTRIFEILAALSLPSQARLLLLGAGEAIRVARVEARPDASDFDRASQHPVEVELARALPQRADGIVDANQSFDRVVSDCLQLVQSWRRTE